MNHNILPEHAAAVIAALDSLRRHDTAHPCGNQSCDLCHPSEAQKHEQTKTSRTPGNERK
jgi:hypothetical protein